MSENNVKSIVEHHGFKITEHAVETITQRRIDIRDVITATNCFERREYDGKLVVYFYRVPTSRKGRTILRVVLNRDTIVSVSWVGWRFKNAKNKKTA